MDKALADRFVGMYVNEWTWTTATGREAVRRLLDEGHRAGVIPAPVASSSWYERESASGLLSACAFALPLEATQ